MFKVFSFFFFVSRPSQMKIILHILSLLLTARDRKVTSEDWKKRNVLRGTTLGLIYRATKQKACLIIEIIRRELNLLIFIVRNVFARLTGPHLVLLLLGI